MNVMVLLMILVNDVNGLRILCVGLGMWKVCLNEVCDVVCDVFGVGYVYVDCVVVYVNESEVGEAL